jgi:hypothetical protein
LRPAKASERFNHTNQQKQKEIKIYRALENEAKMNYGIR